MPPDVRDYGQRWEATVGGPVHASVAITTAPTRKVCCRDLQRGLCHQDLSRQEEDRWCALKQMFDDIVRYSQRRDRPAGELEKPLLLRLSWQGDPLLLLLASAMLLPVTPAFHFFQPANVGAGQRAHASLGEDDEGFIRPAKLLAHMLGSGVYHI